MTFITVLCGCKVGLGQYDYDLGEGDYSKIKRVRSLQTNPATSADTLAGSHDVPDTLLCQSHLYQEQHLRSSHTTCHIQALIVHTLCNIDSQRQLWVHCYDDSIVTMQATESYVGSVRRHLL
jgi:hypothetical protein